MVNGHLGPINKFLEHFEGSRNLFGIYSFSTSIMSMGTPDNYFRQISGGACHLKHDMLQIRNQ